MGPGIVIAFWSVVAAILFAVLLASLCTCLVAYKKGWSGLKWGCGITSAGIVGILALMCVGGGFMICSILDFTAFRLDPPEVSQLAGTYVLTESSQHRLAREKSYISVPHSEITLTATGEVTCVSLPDCLWSGFGQASGQFYSGEGKYEIDTEMSHFYNVVIHNNEAKTASIDGLQLRVMRNDDLRATIGDPDSDDYLYFRKAK
jgi:hypothetical protein